MKMLSEKFLATHNVAYEAGPMRGIVNFNFDAFDKWEEWLTERKWIVHSPAQMDREEYPDWDPSCGDTPAEFTLEKALKRDFLAIINSNATILLPGWEQSTGAHKELPVTHHVGNRVFIAIEDADGNPERLEQLTDEEITYAIEQGVGCDLSLRTRVRILNETRASIDLPAVVDNWDEVVTAALGEVRVTDPITGGQKGSKPAQLGAIDPVALLALARVGGMGAAKYARFNYLKGYAWSLSIDAANRHLELFNAGENLDPESGIVHTAHAAWNLLALTSYYYRELGTDDRPPAADIDLLKRLIYGD